jgi:nicotinamide-nucleotide amidase
MTFESTRLAVAVLEACRKAKLRVATAESCTGGMIAAALTDIAGSSDVVERGFVTYANEAKTQMLGVDKALLDGHGAVSAEVARAMAEGALKNSPADLTVAVTGIAGPGGGTAEKPVGLVHFACARKGKPTTQARHIFPGDRRQVREQTVVVALRMLLAQATGV